MTRQSQKRDEQWAQFEAEVRRELRQARQRGLLSDSFDEIEEVVAEVGHTVQGRLLSTLAEQREAGGGQRCPECGQPMPRRGKSARQLKSSLGEVQFQRERWVCAGCGANLFPLDQRLKLASYHQTTGRLERLVCEIGLPLPYEQAADVLNELLGLSIAGRQVERIVDRHGQRAIAVRDAELAAVPLSQSVASRLGQPCCTLKGMEPGSTAANRHITRVKSAWCIKGQCGWGGNACACARRSTSRRFTVSSV